MNYTIGQQVYVRDQRGERTLASVLEVRNLPAAIRVLYAAMRRGDPPVEGTYWWPLDRVEPGPTSSPLKLFRKKPVVISAIQYDGTQESADACGLVERGGDAWERGVNTLEGFMVASPGDWIITGIRGEKYPCKPDVFEATYEPA